MTSILETNGHPGNRLNVITKKVRWAAISPSPPITGYFGMTCPTPASARSRYRRRMSDRPVLYLVKRKDWL